MEEFAGYRICAYLQEDRVTVGYKIIQRIANGLTYQEMHSLLSTKNNGEAYITDAATTYQLRFGQEEVGSPKTIALQTTVERNQKAACFCEPSLTKTSSRTFFFKKSKLNQQLRIKANYSLPTQCNKAYSRRVECATTAGVRIFCKEDYMTIWGPLSF